MKTIRVHRAQGIGKSLVVEPVTLEIHDEIPDPPTLDDARDTFRREAADILAALKSLPGGTRYELLLLVLRDAEVLYVGA